MAVKIENVSLLAGFHGMLSAKLRAGKPSIAQQRPNKLLSFCLFRAQMACEFQQIRRDWLLFFEKAFFSLPPRSLIPRSLTPPPLSRG